MMVEARALLARCSLLLPMLLGSSTGCTSEAVHATQDAGGAAGSGATGGVWSVGGQGGAGGSGGVGGGGSAGTGAAGGAGGAGGTGGAPAVVEEIEVWVGGRPTSGVPVVVNHADGSLADHGVTGVGGIVTLDVPEGGTATALVEPSVGYPLLSFVTRQDIVQGQKVILDLPGDDEPSQPSGITVTLTLGTPPAGTSSLDIVLPCHRTTRSVSASVQITDYPSCGSQQTTLDVIVIARNTQGGMLGSAASFGNAYAHEPIILSLSSFSTTVVTATAAVDNPPSNSSVSMDLVAFRQQNQDLRLELQASDDNPAAFQLPPALDRGRLTEYVSWPEGVVTRRVVRSATFTGAIPPATTWTFPPSLMPVEQVHPWDHSSPGRPRFYWNQGVGTAASCVAMIAAAVDATSYTLVRFSGKPGATEHRFPELPASLAYARPTNASFKAIFAANISSAAPLTEGCRLPDPLAVDAAGQVLMSGAQLGKFDG